jgi:hypothetical protein
MGKYTYYKFDVGDGAMRRNDDYTILEYLNQNGEWEKNREIFRKFVGGDTDFDEITEDEAEILVQNRKNKRK